MLYTRFPRFCYDADEGTKGGASSAVEAKENNQQPDIAKILEGIDLDELLKQDAVAKKIQSIADGRVTQALSTAKAKWEKEQEEEKDEAKKLAKMSESEKEAYQFKKDKEAFEAQKAAFERSQLEVETAKQLLSLGLPDLSTYITGRDAEETKKNIEAVQKLLGAWKSDALKDAMRGKTPRDTNSNGGQTITPEEFNRMSYSGRMKLYEKNPELYKQLTKK